MADDSVLQSEPIEFRVMDHDVYTSDDAIGLVHVDLSPLLMRIAEGADGERGQANPLMIKGWFPIYDTLRGVRGELFLSAKLQFIGDDNPFRDSSAGVPPPPPSSPSLICPRPSALPGVEGVEFTSWSTFDQTS